MAVEQIDISLPEFELSDMEFANLYLILFTNVIESAGRDQIIESAKKYIEYFSYRVIDDELLNKAGVFPGDVRDEIEVQYPESPLAGELCTRINFAHALTQQQRPAFIPYSRVETIYKDRHYDWKKTKKRWAGMRVLSFDDPYFLNEGGTMVMRVDGDHFVRTGETVSKGVLIYDFSKEPS